MWDIPGPGLEPVSPALAGGFLTTGPPGKSPNKVLNECKCWVHAIDMVCVASLTLTCAVPPERSRGISLAADDVLLLVMGVEPFYVLDTMLSTLCVLNCLSLTAPWGRYHYFNPILLMRKLRHREVRWPGYTDSGARIWAQSSRTCVKA